MLVFILPSHRVPVQSPLQRQTATPASFTAQLPPFWQDVELHGDTKIEQNKHIIKFNCYIIKIGKLSHKIDDIKDM